MSTTFWLNDPSILINKEHILKLWPLEEMDNNDKLNAITRLIIILTVLGYLLTKTPKILVTGFVTLLAIIILQRANVLKTNKDEIVKAGKEAFTSPKYYEMMKGKFTEPSLNNPAMNVLMDEYKYNVERPPAAPIYNEQIRKEVNENAKNENSKLYRNLGDNIIYENSMRNFHTMPNTKIPNNQKDFALFCYGNMPSCKEGDSLQCTKNNAGLRT